MARSKKTPASKPTRIAPALLHVLRDLAARLSTLEGRRVSLVDASARLVRFGELPIREASERVLRRARTPERAD